MTFFANLSNISSSAGVHLDCYLTACLGAPRARFTGAYAHSDASTVFKDPSYQWRLCNVPECGTDLHRGAL